MEFLNRVELRGVVGRADINTFNNSQVCNFSVVTEYSGVDRDGNSNIETTWFNVSAWAGRDGIADLSSIKKGEWVKVTGRLRSRKYITPENEERQTMDLIAKEVSILPREDRMQAQRDR